MHRVFEDRRRQRVKREEVSHFLVLLNDIGVDHIFSGQQPMFDLLLWVFCVDFEFPKKNFFFFIFFLKVVPRQKIVQKLVHRSHILVFHGSQSLDLGFLRKLVELDHTGQGLVLAQTWEVGLYELLWVEASVVVSGFPEGSGNENSCGVDL